MDPQPSVWKSTLEEFETQIVHGDGITGGVAVAAISAAFAVALVRMVLDITARKTESEDQLKRVRELRQASAIESEHLRRAADEDRAAYGAYCEALRLPRANEQERANRKDAVVAALRNATEIPLQAAGRAVRAMELCAEAALLARGDVLADIGAAAAILNGALGAILSSVDANLRRLEDEGLREERNEFEARTKQLFELVRHRLRMSEAHGR